MGKKTEEIKERMRGKLRLKGMAYRTEQSYLGWVDRYERWLRSHAVRGDARARLEAFLTWLARDRRVSASTQNSALHALLFLYREVLGVEVTGVDALRARRGRRVRHAASLADCVTLMREVGDYGGYPTRLIVHLLYGCGLRIGEGCALRVKDLDLLGCRMTIHEAKGNKDRRVLIPPQLLPALATQLKSARAVWERDQQSGLPVALPGALARKYPRAAHQWGWAWLFPQRVPCQHPRTGERVRYHLHEKNVRQAVAQVVNSYELDCRLTPHVLRHSYATHLLERGANPRDLQAALGHNHLDTTMTYLTPEIERLGNVFELMALGPSMSAQSWQASA